MNSYPNNAQHGALKQPRSCAQCAHTAPRSRSHCAHTAPRSGARRALALHCCLLSHAQTLCCCEQALGRCTLGACLVATPPNPALLVTTPRANACRDTQGPMLVATQLSPIVTPAWLCRDPKAQVAKPND